MKNHDTNTTPYTAEDVRVGVKLGRHIVVIVRGHHNIRRVLDAIMNDDLRDMGATYSLANGRPHLALANATKNGRVDVFTTYEAHVGSLRGRSYDMAVLDRGTIPIASPLLLLDVLPCVATTGLLDGRALITADLL